MKREDGVSVIFDPFAGGEIYMLGGCSCGDPDCRELGWPHTWDPSMDDCILGCSQPLDVTNARRYGSGYAHAECIDPPREVVEPLLWEGDDS